MSEWADLIHREDKDLLKYTAVSRMPFFPRIFSFQETMFPDIFFFP